MKMQVIGFEGSQGIGKKSGKPYEIGSLHVIADLAPAFSEDGIAKGQMGTTYPCSLEVIQRIKHLQPPFLADVEIAPVMRFGKREEEVRSVTPVGKTAAAASA
jgi:hypothetical protein